MTELYIGTSGYDYPEWKGVLYPPDLSRRDFLACYSEHFSAVELNFSYYRQPAEHQLAEMAKVSRGRLKFSVKGNRLFTHERQDEGPRDAGWRLAVREFRRSLRPLMDQGLLLSVLLQFPQSFHYEPENRRYLAALLEEFAGVPAVVEFRHRSWQKQPVRRGLEERGAGLCVCDAPDLPSLPKFEPAAGDSLYLRFHGRNKEAWYAGEAQKRYAYLYSDDEIDHWAQVIGKLIQNKKKAQIYFNNHPKGAAVLNARRLKEKLELSFGGTG